MPKRLAIVPVLVLGCAGQGGYEMDFAPPPPPGPPIAGPPGLARAYLDLPSEVKSWMSAAGLEALAQPRIIEPGLISLVFEGPKGRIRVYVSSDADPGGNFSARFLERVALMTTRPLKYLRNVTDLPGWQWAMRNVTMHHVVRHNLAFDISFDRASREVAETLGELIERGEGETVSLDRLARAVPTPKVVKAPPATIRVGEEFTVEIEARAGMECFFGFTTLRLRSVDVDGATAQFTGRSAGSARIGACQRPQDGLLMACASFDIEVIE